LRQNYVPEPEFLAEGRTVDFNLGLCLQE
jgi:hypothetical protein